MTMRLKRGLRSCISLGAGAVLACALPTLAAGHRVEADLNTIQVLADVTLIDRQCRQLAVNFGRLFRYGEAHNIRSSDIMPLGPKHALFMAAMKRRSQLSSDATLCSTVADQAGEEVPGVMEPR